MICIFSQGGAGGGWRDVEAVRDRGAHGNCPLRAVVSSQGPVSKSWLNLFIPGSSLKVSPLTKKMIIFKASVKRLTIQREHFSD